jgi:hypothetical protein
LRLPAPSPKSDAEDNARIFMYPGDRNDLLEFREGDHAWLGVGVYIPPEWDLTQIESRSSDRFATLWGFRHGDEHGPLNGMVLSTAEGESEPFFNQPLLTVKEDRVRLAAAPVRTGVFIHFVLHIRFSRTEAGRNEIWRSDDFGSYRKLADYTGSNLRDSDVDQRSWAYRIGLYEGGEVTQDRQLFYGHLRVGDNVAGARSQVALPGIPFLAGASEAGPPPPPTPGGRAPAPTSRTPDTTPATSCRVPSVKGLRPAAARRRLRTAHCAVGRTRYRRAGRLLRGRVVGTIPRRGTRLARGRKVSLIIGRAPRRKLASALG